MGHRLIYSENKERGVVSILSVIFFIILMSILTISFMRIVTDEQEQVIEDDLSKSALAAARSGVEDAKRALLYCRSLTGTAQTACYADLSNQGCPGIFASGSLLSSLGLAPNRQADGSIKVGDPTNTDNQRYTCVTISQDTPDYVGTLSDGLGDFIPLRSTASFNQVRISWHQTSVDGLAAIPPAGPISLDTNPRKPEWQTPASLAYIAVPRLQLVQYDPSQTLNAQKDSSSGTYLIPNTGGSSTVNVTGAALNSSSMPKRAAVNCITPAPESGYRCTATLDLSGLTRPADAQYYLLVKSQYGTPHYKVELLNSGAPVSFDDVQPQVDSTGAAANVYKRLLSRVAYQTDTFFTSNSIESGTSICKDFFVTANSFSNPCASLLPGGSGVPSSSSGGSAGIGTACSIVVCAPGAGGTAMSWSETIVNLSANDSGSVQGCHWDFGDGTTSDANCNYGDSFSHAFPADSTYADGDSPAKPKKPYTVNLTVTLKNGDTSSASYTFNLPENYP